MWHQVVSVSLRNPIGYGPDSFRNRNKHKDFRIVGDRNYNPAFEVKLNDGSTYMQFYSPSNDSNRLEKLKEDYIKEAESNKQYFVSVWDNPHCEYIQILFQYGILGFLLLIGLIRDLFIRFRRAEKTKELIVITSCLLVYFVSSTAHFPLELARLGYLFMIILGAFYAKSEVEYV